MRSTNRRPKGPSTLRLLVGMANASAVNARAMHPSLVATYRLRVVAMGALITTTALINLVVYMALSQGSTLSRNGFYAVLGIGAAALAAVVLPPWNRILISKWALRALYAWSVYGVFFVGAAVYFDGGGTSVLFLMFPVLTVFFAMAYPQRAQAGFFILTVAVYAGAVYLTGWDVTAADFYIRVASLAVIAVIASVLSGWLVMEMRDRARSSITAEQRAGMLDTVARAARRISSLDASQVLGGALSGAMELGAYEAEVWLLEGTPPKLALQRRIAMEMATPNERRVAALFDKCRMTGMTQVVAVDGSALVACLLHREGEAAGIMLIKMSNADSGDSLMVECMELLAAQVSAGLDVARNVAERRGLEERLAHWAFHDSLTDLPNRVLFGDRLELALARTARDGSKVAVLFLDLDDFKRINDTLGHAAGDELLHLVAERLQACLRPNDTLARYGGDEFVVLVEQIEGPEFAKLVAKRILDALGRPVNIGGTQMNVKTSIGIAITGSRPGADSDVLRRADMAMYQAKASGGRRFVLSPSPETEGPSFEDNDTDPDVAVAPRIGEAG